MCKIERRKNSVQFKQHAFHAHMDGLQCAGPCVGAVADPKWAGPIRRVHSDEGVIWN